GAPQSAFARLISPMSARSSAETFGLPARLRDRQRQYARNPARCQRMMVSGLTIATTSRTDGNQRYSQTNRKRSELLRCGRFGICRRSTLTCCRRTRFSASSVALALKREAWIPRISHQDASLCRPLAASTPNRIIGTHRLILRWFIPNALELAAANAHDWHPVPG